MDQSDLYVRMREHVVEVSYTHHYEKSTTCAILTRSGFVVTGFSSSSSKSEFEKRTGEKRSYEDALKKLQAYFAFVESLEQNS